MTIEIYYRLAVSNIQIFNERHQIVMAVKADAMIENSSLSQPHNAISV